MRYDNVRSDPPAEPCFEPPPRLSATPERRLTARAAARHEASGGAYEFRDNAVSLVREPGGAARITGVGRSVAVSFGLATGRLDTAPDTLGGVLGEAFGRAMASTAVTPFEAAVATPFAACVLLRGVVLPTRAGADAVISWKQVLGDDATARLRAELLRELRPRSTGAPAADAFA